MKRIVFFDISGRISGAEISLLELCRYLSYGISVICPKDSAFEDRLKREGITVIPIDIPLLRGAGSIISKLKNYSYARKARRELETVLARNTFDIFHSNTLVSDFFAGDIPEKYCRRTVCHCRDDPDNRITRTYLSRRDAVISPSRWVERKLKKLNIENVVTIPNGIDTEYFSAPQDRKKCRERFKLASETATTVIGHAAQFIERKGLLNFISCAERLSEQEGSKTYLVAGESLYKGQDFEEEVKERLACSPVKEMMVFTGFIEDMREFYSALDMFVTLSRNEPFGRTPLEAALCGTVSVVSNEGGYRETLEDIQEVLVEPEDEPAVCSAINAILEDRNCRQGLIKKMRARAREFSAERSAQKLEKLYKAL